ncbi:MAG TPA: hypothetical protein VHF25_04375 [Nitriliruptorales bacterium]|nr:hypothetical protein [Nitriliruptorales bacterium]
MTRVFEVPGDGHLVAWRRVGRRVGLLVAGWVAFGALGAGVTAALSGGLTATRWSLWLGVGLAGAVASAVAIVAWSAVRGMLRAGGRGERLAAGDVGLLPPRRRPERPR